MPGRDGQDIRIENNVFRRKIELFGENSIGPRANLDLAREGVGLAALVEGHDDHRRAVASDEARLLRNASSPSLS